MAVFGQNGFRMELHALDIHFAMTQAHNRLTLTRFVGSPGGNLKAVGQSGRIHHQAMVPGCCEGAR